MKTLQYTKTHNPAQLHDELMTAIPLLRPLNGQASMQLSGDGTTVVMSVPDATVDAQVTAVVNAHAPQTMKPQHDSRIVVRKVQSTNGTPAVETLPIAANTGYIGTVFILGVQTVSPFARASFRKAFQIVRRTGNAILDGQEDLHTPFRGGAAAATWTAVLGVSAENVTITVTGSSGVTIDWTIWSEFYRFNKDGLD